MSCAFTKMRLLRKSPIELSFVECLNSECTAQLSYIRGLHSMAYIATLPCHIQTQFSSPSLLIVPRLMQYPFVLKCPGTRTTCNIAITICPKSVASYSHIFEACL